MAEKTLTITGETAYEWIKSVANILYWEDTSLWSGKDCVPWKDPGWMEWRSSLTVDTFMERAREYVPVEVYVLYEAWVEREDE